MGGSNSKKDSKKGRSDDGCIGNRKVRTIILAILIGLFFVLSCPFTEVWADFWGDAVDTAGDFATDEMKDNRNSWWMIFGGAIICIVGCVLAAILFLIPSQENVLGRVAGFILIVGGIIYLIGWIWQIILQRNVYDDTAWDLLPDETKQQIQASLTAQFGEALLPGGSAILLGLDAMLQIYENEAYRLSSNLGIICTVAALCFNAYYLQTCTQEQADNLECVQIDGVEAIATGYLILFWVCLVYIILYICACCTCNCKDTCLVRLIIAVILVIGGLLTAIGYWVYVGADDEDTITTDDYFGKVVVYYVGYSILIAGLACVWALDMAFDDVKNNRK